MRIQCDLCGEIIESTYPRDFKECSCKKSFIDAFDKGYGKLGFRYGGEVTILED